MKIVALGEKYGKPLLPHVMLTILMKRRLSTEE